MSYSYSTNQDLFYLVEGERVTVLMKAYRLRETEERSEKLEEFKNWMAASLPHRTLEIIKRVDGFFGDGDYYAAEISKGELILVKLSLTVKTREAWVEEYHARARRILEELKETVSKAFNMPLMQATERAYMNMLFNDGDSNELTR